MKKTWLITPRDPLMLRNARPTGDGGVMRSLPFPWPSTVAGFARSRIGVDPTKGTFTLSVEDAKKIEVRGPWLAELPRAPEGQAVFYVPAPHDAVFHDATPTAPRPHSLHRTRMIPSGASDPLRPGESTDLDARLTLLAPAAPLPAGKATAGPAFWRWDEMLRWLDAPAAADDIDEAALGLPALRRDARVHVRLDAETLTAADGMLFVGESLCFTAGDGVAARPLALAFHCADRRLADPRGVAVIGGERRVSFLSSTKSPMRPHPGGRVGEVPELRVVLVTPAVFADGAVPKKIDGLDVIAAAVARYESLSGWDFERAARHAGAGQKATRRMAPAGSVYWLRAESAKQAKQWAKDHWLESVCDHPQDRADGFGLCVVGVA